MEIKLDPTEDHTSCTNTCNDNTDWENDINMDVDTDIYNSRSSKEKEQVRIETKINSDIAEFPEKLSDCEKRQIINLGPQRSMGPFPIDSKNRSFSSIYYKKKTKTGQEINR